MDRGCWNDPKIRLLIVIVLAAVVIILAVSIPLAIPAANKAGPPSWSAWKSEGCSTVCGPGEEKLRRICSVTGGCEGNDTMITNCINSTCESCRERRIENPCKSDFNCPEQGSPALNCSCKEGWTCASPLRKSYDYVTLDATSEWKWHSFWYQPTKQYVGESIGWQIQSDFHKVHVEFDKVNIGRNGSTWDQLTVHDGPSVEWTTIGDSSKGPITSYMSTAARVLPGVPTEAKIFVWFQTFKIDLVPLSETPMIASEFTMRYRGTDDSDFCSLLDPCLNGGTCSNIVDKYGDDNYQCECPQHYFGRNCRDQSKCISDPCQNNSTCTEYVDKDGVPLSEVNDNSIDFRCECLPGFRGQLCEKASGILWIGGMNHDKSVDVYSLADGTIQHLPELTHLSCSVQQQCAATMKDNRIFMIGGRDDNHIDILTITNQSTSTPTYTTNTLTTTYKIEAATAHHFDGGVFIFGGTAGGPRGVTNKVMLLKGDSLQQFTLLGTPRYGHHSVEVDGTVYICGGLDDSYDTLSSCESVSLSTGKVTQIAPMHKERELAASAYHPDHGIIVTGGLNKNNKINGRLSSVELYNIHTNSWSDLPPMTTPRQRLSALIIGNTLYVIGGYETPTVEYFDFNTNKWVVHGRLPDRYDIRVGGAVFPW